MTCTSTTTLPLTEAYQAFLDQVTEAGLLVPLGVPAALAVPLPVAVPLGDNVGVGVGEGVCEGVGELEGLTPSVRLCVGEDVWLAVFEGVSVDV